MIYMWGRIHLDACLVALGTPCSGSRSKLPDGILSLFREPVLGLYLRLKAGFFEKELNAVV